jgi:hypothetical protein
MQRLLNEIVLGVMVLSILVMVFTAQHVEFRYADPLVPLTIPWVANGLKELGDWGRNLATRLSPRLTPRARILGGTAQIAICVPMLVLSFVDTRTLSEFRIEGASNLGVRKAGLWLKNQKPEAKRVAAMNSILPYYSSSIMVQFPYAEPSPTLLYLNSKKVDYVVLDGHYSKSYETVGDWLARGIPDTRAELVYDSGGPTENRIEIYRWDTEDSDTSAR